MPERTGRDERTGTGLRRGAGLVLVVGLIVLGVVVDRGAGEPAGDASYEPSVATRDAETVAVPPAGTISSAWYCAEGTSAEGGRADETIVIANTGQDPVRAVVTVLRGEEAPAHRSVEVAPRSRTQVRVADVAETQEPGVVVEVFGGLAAVEHRLRGAGDIATAPCVRRPSTRWWFAGGTTVQDARDVVALLNPFRDDAIVDLTFFTEEGIEQPAALQAMVVPGRSRVSVPVHEHVLRRERVAAEVVATSGRVVAERSVRWDGSTARRGLAVIPGAARTAETWSFPEGLTGEDVIEDVWVLNPHEDDTAVEIQPEPDGDALVEPTELDVPGRSAVRFRVNEVLSEGGHSLQVTALGRHDVVASLAIASHEEATRPGYAMVPGIDAGARRWLFPAGSADDTFDEWITVAGAANGPATVSISVLAGGVLLVPEGLGSLEVEALTRRSFRLGDSLKRSDLPLVVESDQPVGVVRGLYRSSAVSLSPGIPFEE